MTKAEQKQMNRAATQGRGAYLRAMAIIHRAGSSKTQREIEREVEAGNCWEEFTMVNGSLVHNSEA